MGGRLEGHVAVVTGAAGGIGSAIASLFRAEGCCVVALDLKPQTFGDVCLQCDLGCDESVLRAAEAIDRLDLQPTIVVHAAAMAEGRPTLETSGGFLTETMNINVSGALRLAQSFAPAMLGRRRGVFLFVSSINSTFATPGLAAYAASKAALDSLCRTMALEFAPHTVRVNAVRPASVDTLLLQRGFGQSADPDAARAQNVARHPLGRLGTSEDVARLALFLCSDEASWITGADYLIDGGASITRR